MNFAKNVADDPAKYHVAQEDVDALVTTVDAFLAALQANFSPVTRNQLTTRAKLESRAKAEEIIRRIGHMIRADNKIENSAKAVLRIRERAKRSRKSRCPVEPPRLTFVRARHTTTAATPMHELKFSSAESWGKSKPQGATRLELFVDLIPPEGPVPSNPGATASGRPWYLRSFTRSPIVIEPPMARVPMRVVYWARWADNTGNVGPFSQTVEGWISFSNQRARPVLMGRQQAQLIKTDTSKQLVDESTYSVAVIEAHYLTVNTRAMREENPKLEAPKLEVTVREMKQIEGPAPIEASAEAA